MSILTHTPFAELVATLPPINTLPPLDERLQGLEPILRALKTAPDTRLLIIGGQPRNFSQEVLDSPRVVIWHSDDRRVMRHSRIPSDVAAVVSTRWTDHAVMGHVKREAKRIGAAVHFQHLTPNVIETLLHAADIITMTPAVEPMPSPAPAPVQKHKTLTLPPKPVAKPVAVAPPTPADARPVTARKDGSPAVKAGALKQWLITNVGQIKETIDVMKEAHALLPRLKADGIETTHVSLTTTMYRLRKEQRGGVSPVRTARSRNRPTLPIAPPPAVVPEAPVVVVEAAPSAPAVPVVAAVETPQQPETTALQKKLSGILSLLDEQQRALSEQQAALSVIRDEILTVQPMLTAADSAATELPILRRRFERLQALITDANW